MAGLDETDLRILAELRADGRLSMRALAERVHVSRAGCYSRVERLHRDGVITGYTAVTDPRKVGKGLAAYVYLKVRQNSWRAVRAALNHIDEIEHGALVSGENDLIIFVRTADADSLRDLVFERLQTMDDVVSTQTVLVFDEL
ncbi:Lrp/AsnC family transcriptional regulator [Amycolatopsis suaedae]|uniref:Lrp/AsnC family transcriptional regulator n=1 Tax=Amycolatopsis suaedae TaxID=2510978 RepID=A0A4Q7JFS0_9PSEU|nr:Lrp/AsnC family transcriptional regulator [Amycolatopsis suaedae]RZQ66126.1 Lrp/AsnC family transcriptional regulator [Amycolatopsis suaedae]